LKPAFCTVLKKVLVTLLGLFGATRRYLVPPWWLGPRGIAALVPPFYARECSINEKWVSKEKCQRFENWKRHPVL